MKRLFSAALVLGLVFDLAFALAVFSPGIATWAADRGVSLGFAKWPSQAVGGTTDVVLTMPTGYDARLTNLSNDGDVRVYFAFGDVAVNRTTDMFLEAGEAFPPSTVRWRKMHLLAAAGTTTTVRVTAEY